MNANELRIGNFVSLFRTYEIVQIQLTQTRFIMVLNGEYEAEPIPLTEEWLVKFGFFRTDKFGLEKEYQNGSHVIIFKHEEHDVFVVEIYECPICIDIKHIHQLQNLYFALTGEELTIK